MASKGNCYLCGAEFGKTAMKNHLVKVHGELNGQQECCLLKNEGVYNKDYWLYIDIPIDKPLSDVDSFLRRIWLECCGHLSCFLGPGRSEIRQSRKLKDFFDGDKLVHEYDFGTTTELLITVIGTISRKKQRGNVRLLARNISPQFECGICGKPAVDLCTECIYDADNPYCCAECGLEHEHAEMLRPVTNSPRMGECGYTGELDVFAFDSPKEATGK
jgi:predicted RNA-binding Zn-ribbon protein involved in translation (DUF1610 family)